MLIVVIVFIVIVVIVIVVIGVMTVSRLLLCGWFVNQQLVMIKLFSYHKQLL